VLLREGIIAQCLLDRRFGKLCGLDPKADERQKLDKSVSATGTPR
jgi:hypothetical protein